MSKELLWSIDITDMNQAQEIFDQLARNMPEATLMCLSQNSHINPVKVADYKKNLDWPHQEHGWLFCQKGELKWRRLTGGILRFVYLGSDDNKIEQANYSKQNIEELEKKASQLIAWGIFEQSKKSCLEESLGQVFHYPFPTVPEKGTKKTSRLAFQIYSYIDPEDQSVKFWRHSQIRWATTKK